MQNLRLVIEILYFQTPCQSENLYKNLCLAEINKPVETMNPKADEHTVAACQSPEEESKVEEAIASEENTAVSHSQDVPKEPTTTSSPDTDSPVMINVDVSPRVKMLV